MITHNHTFNQKMLDQPVCYSSLVLLGFSAHDCGYFCPPQPAHGGMYRVSTKDQDGGLQYYVYLTDENATWVRDVNTLEQLNNIHKGFCDKPLFHINNY